MRGPTFALTCILIVAGLAVGALPGTVAEGTDHDAEEVWTWKTDGDPQQMSNITFPVNTPVRQCDWFANSGDAEDSPCNILSYEIGNSDTHVFFKWNLATLEFGGVGEDGNITYSQGFRGNLEEGEERTFGFDLVVNSESVQLAQTTPEHWEYGLDVPEDRSEGWMVVSLSFEQLSSRLLNGTVPGETFEVASRPSLEADILGVGDCFATIGQLFCGTNRLPPPGNSTFELMPYLSFQPPAQTVYHEIEGLPQTIEHAFDDATVRVPWLTENHVYNWSMDAPAIGISADTSIEQGSVNVKILDPSGEAAFEAESLEEAAEELIGLGSGDWVIEIEFDRFIGSFTLDLEEVDLPDGGGGNGGGGQGGGGGTTGNSTNGDGADVDEGGIPGPGAIVVVVALLGALTLIRSRRARN